MGVIRVGTFLNRHNLQPRPGKLSAFMQKGRHKARRRDDDQQNRTRGRAASPSGEKEASYSTLRDTHASRATISIH